MGRDPLDTSLDVLIDQALSVAAQLRRTEVVRVSFATIGVDAHALADTVAAARATANHARAVRDREAALTLVSQEDGAALLHETQFWVQRTRLALSDPNIDAPHAAAAVLATLRHVRTLRAMTTAVRTSLQALIVRRDQLSGVTHIAALIDAGAALADRIDNHRVESENLYAARAIACARARAEAGALRATLRDVRRTWRAAAIGNRLMPPFDLRLAAAATATRRTGPRAADPAAPPRRRWRAASRCATDGGGRRRCARRRAGAAVRARRPDRGGASGSGRRRLGHPPPRAGGAGGDRGGVGAGRIRCCVRRLPVALLILGAPAPRWMACDRSAASRTGFRHVGRGL